MVEKEHYIEIGKKYGDCASWAVWADEGDTPKSNIGDLRIFDLDFNPNLLLKLNRNVIMVGLNISRRIEHRFGNFHDGRPGSQDYKIRYAFRGTKFYGAYMTDVIKDFEQEISGKVKSYLHKNRAFEDHNILLFRQELDDIKADDPLLIAFGNESFHLLEKHFRKSFRIVKVPHYSIYISQEQYRREVGKSLDGFNF